jgi:hypothetical protein
MRKEICVQHWVSNRVLQNAFEDLRGLTVRISNFV